MSHPAISMMVSASLLLLVGGFQSPVGTTAKGKDMPVPAGARVSIELDKNEYFLGENVLLHFCIENSGKEPFQIDLGGDYRGASRHLRFNVKALDAAGKLCDDPDPSGFCMGGLSHSPTVEPGQKRYRVDPTAALSAA